MFISFDSEIPAEDKIMVEIDGGMFEAKRINPYTYVFTFAGKILLYLVHFLGIKLHHFLHYL